MKKIITIVAVMIFVFAIGSVLADQMPSMTESKEVGILLNSEAPGHAKRFYGDLFYAPQDVIPPTAKKDFGGPVASEKIVDVGTALYNSAFETKFAEAGVRGSAAGGVAKEDENTRIWDNLLSAPGGSDLP